MSYDTTVHDALDPPAARVVDDHDRRTHSPSWFTRRRILAPTVIATASFCLLGGITWTVARLSLPIEQRVVEENEATQLNLSPSTQDGSMQLHGRP